MRALHMNFWLHHPYKLHERSEWDRGYFGGEAEFRKADQEEYQPLLALLERNSQRYSKLKISLAVSGMWLEQAERWNMELIRRVKKLVEAGSVELIATPYYQTMAAFYNLDELKTQIELTQEKYQHFFGKKSKILALPGLCFHNKIGKWAEDAGFKGILVGDAREVLDWRSVNYLYEVRGCENLRVLCENRKLSEMVMEAGDGATVEVSEEIEMDLPDPDLKDAEVSGAEAFVRRVSNDRVRESRSGVRKRKVFAAKKFQKELDLAFLRGNLVNLCLKPEAFAKWREAGIVGFFDELIKLWMETPGSRIVGPEEVMGWQPVAEISIKRTVSSGGVAEKEYMIPDWWSASEDKRMQEVFATRDKVVAKNDKDLYMDFARLAALDYARGGDEFEQIWEDLNKKVADVAVPKDRAIVKGREGLIESTAVRVKFDKEAFEAKRRREQLLQMYREANASEDEDIVPREGDMDDMEATIQVLAQRMKMIDGENERDLSELEEAEVVADDIWMEEEEAATVDDEAESSEETEVNVDDTPDVGEQPKVKRKVRRKKIIIE